MTYATTTSPIMHLICPPPPQKKKQKKFRISIVFNFSWDICNTQEKSKTKVMQNCGGASKVHYGKCGSGIEKLTTYETHLCVFFSCICNVFWYPLMFAICNCKKLSLVNSMH